ncbi:MAG: response regulator, partial [Candidatus Dormibacteria bacterium]
LPVAKRVDTPVESGFRPARTDRYRVLVVDDRPDIRMLVRARLGMLHDIEIVGEGSNGAEALILVSALAPDVVVLDLEMPVMRGDEAIPQMRVLAPGVRILLFTGAEPDVLAAISEDATPDEVVTKGGPLTELVDKVRLLLEMEPHDVLRVELGTIPLDLAVTAFDTWVGLNMRILDSLARGDELVKDQLAGATPEELQALVGVYAHLGDNLQKAAREEAHEVVPIIHLLRTTAAAARRALVAINDTDLQDFYKAWNYSVPAGAVAALAEMRQQLIDGLPTSSADENDTEGGAQVGRAPAPDAQPNDEGKEARADRRAAGVDRAAAAEDRAAGFADRRTGALSRTAGNDQLRREIARARDTGSPLAVISLGVGQAASADASVDLLMVAVSAVLHQQLRDFDLVVRQTSGEFLCVLPGLDLQGAAQCMGQLGGVLAAAPGMPPVTSGIAVLQDDDSPESLVGRAVQERQAGH